MNLIEAVKSGRPFKRKAWGTSDWEAPESWSKPFLKYDILADDWELEESKVEITATQFHEAARKVWEEDFDKTRESPHFFAKLIAKRLGLEAE